MKIVLSLLLFVGLIVKVEASQIQKPEEIIQKIFTLAAQTDLAQNQALKVELDNYVDFKEMSLNILGSEANKRSKEDLAWFEKTIKEIITKSVYPEAPSFLKGVKISYRTSIIDDAKATVPSVVSKKGDKTDVAYKLKLNGNNEWKVVDVAIDEESWVKTINQNIKKTMNEKGWSGIKTLLTNKVTALNKPKA